MGDCISDEDLERYYLGMVPEGLELAVIEEHLLACSSCVERAVQSDLYVNVLRAGIILGDYDLG